MKKLSSLLIIFAVGTSSFAQEADSTGLEGDNLDLNGVLELFQESESVEDFEKKLNTESNGVNNLDLNNDGDVDYVKVVDHSDSTSHALALQVDVDENESQDVAVIEMDQSDDETVNLQVIGDDELYGEDYIVEPADENDANVVVNVWAWKPIRFMYGPRYVRWVSPYRWGYHPNWWKPWRRVHWRVYHPRVIRYHRPVYRRVAVRRCHIAHHHYHVHKVHSPGFHKAHHPKHATMKKASPAPVKKNAAPQKTNRKRPGGTLNNNSGSRKKGRR